MLPRRTGFRPRTDFLSGMILVVGLALLPTLAFHAHANQGAARCPAAVVDGQRHAAVLDFAPSQDGGYARCQTDSRLAWWASATWGASTR